MHDVADRIERDAIGNITSNPLLYPNLLNVHFKLCISHAFYINQYSGFAYAANLAIDYSTGNLFYTAIGPIAYQGYIGVAHRVTSIHKTLIHNLSAPWEIAIFSSKG